MNKFNLLTWSLVFLIQSSCNQPNKGSQTTMHPPLSVRVEAVSRMDMADSIQIYGMVSLRQEARLASQFDGRLKDFSILQGDRVEQGQKIGIIVPPIREALDQPIHEMSIEQQKLVANEVNEIPLYSPISGTVLEVMQHNGDVLQKGESIVHIAHLNHLDIYGDLPLSFLPQVKKLQTLKIIFVDYPHKPLFLPVSAFDGKVDPQKQTIQIRLALNNPDMEFRPGMMVRLIFPDKIHTESMVIPRTALLEEEGVYSVFVVRDEEVEKRGVQIGIKHDDYVEVLSGLNDLELVASSKAYSLTDGMKVTVQ